MKSVSIIENKMITLWHQQVLALDTKYNSQRLINNCNLGTFYIRRRSQLLQEKYCKDFELQSRYLKLRSELFRRRYGVHHVFDQHSAAISMLKFANNDRSRFCCASMDGSISICEATSNPPKVVSFLQGHRKGVTAIDWSTSNDFLVSSSLDTTVRLWLVQSHSKVNCLRVVYDLLRAENLCCAFAPSNNNIVLTGNSRGLLQILNISTGKYTRGGTVKIGGKITSLTCEESGGSLVWIGNDRGIIVSFRLEPGLGRLTKLCRIEATEGIVTSLSWRPWLSKDFPWPTLLVSSACNALFLYRIADDQGNLSLWKKYPIRHRQHFIRSTFCPQIGSSLIATGSEDGSIHLLDSVRDGKSAQVNRLLGHSAPTLTLCFNYDESLLASGDHHGLIILWRNYQCQT
ncbi:PREDICTED: WD repeat-containing protein 13-like isoform X2 [Ceratosolen solmsi marchali]|uniref:WD repeat-containing protein 13-like isoform X2 n=1 Tax=Ceratosolen solmsi marchali TaxID=326594 RepID=A0AAJ6YF05_9HYME|nr:PREDICTED: WD repeat-containing protein 13-like isoform X2 [Ceratosolen solmsi marchali]